MASSAEHTEAVRKTLETAVNENDFPTFSSEYHAFLTQFPAFNRAFSNGPTDLTVHSAIFGHKCFFLRQTNDTDARQILTRARAASRVFSQLSVSERLEFLTLLQRNVENYKDAIQLVITADTGKPIELSEGEMAKGKEWFDYALKKAEGQIGTTGKAQFQLASRPKGAAQIIGAYNYPYALAIGGIVGALAGGNGAIVSAPLKAPNWVFPFMKAAREGKPWASDFAQIADSLVQCSVGVNRNLTAEADIVHFVGGDQTGTIISKSRGLKPTILEMGGSNVVVVMNSAVSGVDDAKKIADAIYNGFGPATGQRCTAPRFLCVQKGAEDVITALGAICEDGDHHIGNPFTRGVKMGPLVDRGAHQKMEEAIALAHELGARVYGTMSVSSNHIPQALSSFWVKPVMIDWGNVDPADTPKWEQINAVMQNEIFGPLLHVVHRVDDMGGAIATANRLDSHGLAGAIFTKKQSELDEYAAGVRLTSLVANEAPKDRSPWGPHGHPGLNTIGGEDHFRLYCDKSVIVSTKPLDAEAAPA